MILHRGSPGAGPGKAAVASPENVKKCGFQAPAWPWNRKLWVHVQQSAFKQAFRVILTPLKFVYERTSLQR